MKLSELKISEDITHQSVCEYIKLKYPNVIFNTDLSGLRLTMQQALKVKKLRSSNGFPDLVIYEPRLGYNGLFLELKRPSEKLFCKDGKMRKNNHLEEQFEMHEKLRQRGYYCQFAVGFLEAKLLIDNYLQHEPTR